ncbi:MAG TPA: ATP-binding protein [Sediminibacterium sp.]|nr:MAG: hybrid sensor histidine kinase/response regulator [Sphingobacteriia bacterium 39-39-8]HQR93949.1 ATP-binding protein [Sediminibacterium sp.]HQS54592.1 ATP-binding protein [Sediminibacterium sp.]
MNYKELEYARSLIEASLDPLVTISTKGKIMDMNHAMEIITGKTRTQLISTDFFDYFTEPDKARQVYEAVFAKGFVKNHPLVMRDHKLTDVLFNGSVFKDEDGLVLGAVVVARDVTEQKRFEKELTEARVFAELATEIAQHAKDNAEAASLIAGEAVKAKQQFLSNMSHEIRTPMNAIIGFTKVLFKTELSVKQLEYLSAIKTSGDALIVLINDILDLAKVDAGKMIFEHIPFNIANSISAMLHLFEPKIQEKNLSLIKQFDNTIPLVLLGDPVRLHQIIINLLSNAVKFTSEGSITLGVTLVEEKAESAIIRFSITDTGIGIQEAKMQTIFENFQQASSGTSRLYGGTGLGLAIVKQLVEQQGGSVSVISEIAKGSEFSFLLEFLKSSHVEEILIDLESPHNDISHLKILVVEDIPLNQLLMKTVLDDFGFEREIAANGKIAIEMMAVNKYDLVLMDLQMPEMNGFEATQYIRNVMHSNIPIIALTADVTTVDLAKCKLVGMNDYIAKPVDEKLLYNKIVGLASKNLDRSVGKTELVPAIISTATKCTDLDYLEKRTKSNPLLMLEMIALYLEQTPTLIAAMKLSWQNKDWQSLHAAMHKLIPSFSIMGISPDFENMAKQVKEFALSQQQTDGIQSFVLQLETVCVQACIELQDAFKLIEKLKPTQPPLTK